MFALIYNAQGNGDLLTDVLLKVSAKQLLILLAQVKNQVLKAVFEAVEQLLCVCGCSCTLQLGTSVLTSRDVVAVV